MSAAVLATARRWAASIQLHGVEYHRREQLALAAWHASGDTVDADGLLACLRLAEAVPPPPARALLLARFPWFAFVAYFVQSRGDEEAEAAALRAEQLVAVLPWLACSSDRRLYLDSVLDCLARRITAPPSDRRANTQHRLEMLTDMLRAGDCACLLEVTDAFIGLAVRVYDAVADELRWATLPTVHERRLVYDDTDACRWLALCRVSLCTVTDAFVFLCAPHAVPAAPAVPTEPIGMYVHRQGVRARLLVQLFDCIAHYARVGTYAFIHRAAVALLLHFGAEETVETLLPLVADCLRSTVVLMYNSTGTALVQRPTLPLHCSDDLLTATFLFETVSGEWRVARLRSGATAPAWLQLPPLPPPPPPPIPAARAPPPTPPVPAAQAAPPTLFDLLRSPKTDATTRLLSGELSVTMDNLLRLVGGAKDRFLNGDAVRDLLLLATRDIADIERFEPLAVDTTTARSRQLLAAAVERVRARLEASSATRLLVPWNNRSGHWTLLWLDLPQQTAHYTNSLTAETAPREMTRFCRLFFGDQWTGSITQVPSPQQVDGYNCGVFVILNAWYVAHRRPLPARYPPGADLRLYLAKCWLANQSLDFV